MKEHKIKTCCCNTDVLIVGHGIAGVCTALYLKEISPDTEVVLVDKSVAGWGGKANKGGCILMDIAKDATPEEIVEWHVRNTGEYLNNQKLFLNFVQSIPSAIDKLEEWGCEIRRDANGTPLHLSNFAAPWQLIALDANFLLELTKTAKTKGCIFLEKVAVTDLLTNNDNVVGAYGISLIEQKEYIFHSKAVVLANGNQDYKAMTMWSSARGDGIAAAWRAGAEMRNAEFGTFRIISAIDVCGEQNTGEDYLYNANGEYISPKYRPWLQEQKNMNMRGTKVYDNNGWIHAGMYKEASEGKGPIFYHISENDTRANSIQELMDEAKFPRKYWKKHRLALNEMECAGMRNPDAEAIPVTTAFIGEQSPLKVDESMRTSLLNLWAVGDICYNGSGIPGATPAPPARIRGSGLAFAIVSANYAATSIASNPLSFEDSVPSQIEEIRSRVLAPLYKESGFKPKDIMQHIKKIVAKVDYSNYMSEERLVEALNLILKEKEKLEGMIAEDMHYVASANEARSMVLCAEMTFRSALHRKESRGWFIREDYPQRDDDNWLKTINFKNSNDKFNFWYEDVPIEQYPFELQKGRPVK